MKIFLSLTATLLLGWSSARASTALVAYSRLTDGYWQVWIYDVGAGTHRQVTRSVSDKHSPTWTPGGEIVFTINGDSLFRVRSDATGEAAVLRDAWPATDPAFEPRGTRLVLAHLRTDIADVSSLWLVPVSGGARHALTRGPGRQVHPTWSPDAAWIVFEHSRGTDGSDLRRVSADGKTNELVLEADPGVRNQKPAFSPDASRLAYASNASGDYEIWVLMPPNASGAATQLTHSRGLDTAPAWSPDGRALAFTSRRRGKLEVWNMRADGTEQRPLFEIDSPAGEPAWR